MKKRSSMEYKLIQRLFFRLLPYQVLLLIINAANGIVDSLFASNCIGQSAISALGLYSPMDHFLYAASIMFVSGAQLISSGYLGKGEKEKVNGIFSTDLIAACLLGLVTMAVLMTASLTDLTRSFVTDEAERTALNQYVLGQSLGMPALLLGQQLFAFLSLENRTKRTMAASISCFAANIVMDTFFVLVLDMGTLGLGLASAAAVWVFFLVQAQYYVSGKSEIRFSPRQAHPGDALQIMRRGYSGALSRFVEMFRCIIVNMLLLTCVGSAGLSAFAAINSVMGIFWPIPFGMVAIARILLGISLGEEDRRSMADSMHIIVTRGIVLTAVLAAVLMALAEPITNLFFRDVTDPVYRMTVTGFRLMPMAMPLAILGLNYAAYAQAAQKKTLSIAVPLLDGAGFVVLFSCILIPAIGMNGLYFANLINGVLVQVFIFLYAWAARKKRPRNIEDLLLIPDSFGASDEDRMDLTVHDLSGVVDVSAQVIDFCRKHGVDQRRSGFAGLALEEMAGNISSTGLPRTKKTTRLICVWSTSRTKSCCA